MQHRVSRLPALAFVASLALVATAILLPAEFAHYKRWLELRPEETGLRITLLASVLSKTLFALVVLGGTLGLLARVSSPRTLRWIGSLGSLGILGFLVVDLEVQANTGNNILHYWPLLRDPDPLRWAGAGLDIRGGLARVAWALAIAFGPGVGLAWWVEAWVGRSPARRGGRLLGCAMGAALLVLVASAGIQSRASAPAHFYHLGERMPWRWLDLPASDRLAIEASQREAQRVYTAALPRLDPPRSFASLLLDEAPASRPDILLIVVESLRHDVLEDATMPRLSSAAAKGARFDPHYATSNASHYGLFALLFGRSPLLYFETLASGEAPTLPSQLRRWGYANHLLTCSDTRWLGMERFMGSDDFAVETLHDPALDECDRHVVRRAASLLTPGERPPRFVFAFLMSTHFGYHFPEGGAVFAPSAPPPNALELSAARDSIGLRNRYRNSAHHIDDLIGALIEGVDLDRTLVLVTSDHGESLFDDGTIAHSSLLSEIQTRAPLVILGHGVEPASAQPGPSDHTDLLPTILAHLGVAPGDLRAFPGRDLFAPGGPEFVPLVHARADEGVEDLVALVSEDRRYAVRLDSRLARATLLGHLRPDGRPSRESLGPADEARVNAWLGRYLDSLAHP